MRQLGAKLTDSEINLLVQEADVDGDGQVDINEASDFVSHCYSFLVQFFQEDWIVDGSKLDMAQVRHAVRREGNKVALENGPNRVCTMSFRTLQ